MQTQRSNNGIHNSNSNGAAVGGNNYERGGQMKTRVTIYAENDEPLEKLGDQPTEKVRMAWELIVNLTALQSGEVARVENVEVWE